MFKAKQSLRRSSCVNRESLLKKICKSQDFEALELRVDNRSKMFNFYWRNVFTFLPLLLVETRYTMVDEQSDQCANDLITFLMFLSFLLFLFVHKFSNLLYRKLTILVYI